MDRVVSLLRERGIASALVNLGGSSVYGLGAPPGKAPGRSGSRTRPTRRGSPSPCPCGIARSRSAGGTQRFFEKDGVRQRLDSLFPRLQDVPASVDFAPGGGEYSDGLLYLVDGEVRRWTGPTGDVSSPVCVERDGRVERRRIGPHASLTKDEALAALAAAVRAWDDGRGPWPTMGVGARVDAVLAFVSEMEKAREESVRLLMWEIAKTRADAEKEFDRTVQYMRDTVEALKELDRAGSRASSSSGGHPRRRSAARRSASCCAWARSTTRSTRPSPR